MINKKQIIFIITIIFILPSCSLKTGYLLYKGKSDEIIATQEFKDYIKTHPHPSIVLRVPKPETLLTKSESNNEIYNAIEKELIISGFDVKDRGLFNEVMNKSPNLSYSDVNNSTQTDLILELASLNNKIKHTTNRIFTKKGKEKIFKNYSVSRVGASIEFKLVMVKANTLAGSYSFYYTPCFEKNNDCTCKIAYKKHALYPYVKMCNDNSKTSFESVEQNTFVLFVRDGVKKMLVEITK